VGVNASGSVAEKIIVGTGVTAGIAGVSVVTA
jgi:hypothetical protein